MPVPEDLHATLRPYQDRGYRWMMRNLRAGMGSIIADDMGLGKTLQVLSVLERLRAEGELDAKPALVVVPATLLRNWQREAAKFAPKLIVNIFYGQHRDLSLIAGSHIILTLRSSRKDFEKLAFRIMVIDEAQAIKNYKTAGFRAVRSMKADAFIAMSGTPVENSLMEYWSVMEAANPGLLGTHSYFHEHFASPIENRHDKAVADRFKRITASFILRRMKTDKAVIDDLPDKVTTDEYCRLTKVQAALYQTTLKKSMRIIEATKAGSMARKAMVLQLIVKLKQICNAPAQYEPVPGYDDPSLSGKMLRLF